MCVKVNSYNRILRSEKIISMTRHRILMKSAARFTELVNDLGYTLMFYPQSKVTLYLPKLASGIYRISIKIKRKNFPDYTILENRITPGNP